MATQRFPKVLEDVTHILDDMEVEYKIINGRLSGIRLFSSKSALWSEIMECICANGSECSIGVFPLYRFKGTNPINCSSCSVQIQDYVWDHLNHLFGTPKNNIRKDFYGEYYPAPAVMNSLDKLLSDPSIGDVFKSCAERHNVANGAYLVTLTLILNDAIIEVNYFLSA